MSKFEGQVDVRSSGELIEGLYNVSLRGNPNIKPYKDALITIEELHPNILAPTQRYVLKSEIRKIEQLRWNILEEYGQDILRLNGYLKVKYPRNYIIAGEREEKIYESEESATIDILPVVVEEYIDFCGYPHYLIADGQHRSYVAYMMQMPLRVAFVRGVNRHYLYYAYPLPKRWDQVELLDKEIPSGYIKKFHRMQNHKDYFRDYNSIFENIGASRPYAQK